jgi:hypothetical protein
MAQPTIEQPSHTTRPTHCSSAQPYGRPTQPATRARRIRPKSNCPHAAPHATFSGFSLRAALSVSPSLSQNLNPRLLEPPAAAVRGAAEQSRAAGCSAAAPPRRCVASARLPSARRLFCSSPSVRLPRRRPRPSPCSAVRRGGAHLHIVGRRRPLAHRRYVGFMAYVNFDNELAHELIESDRVTKRAEPSSFSSSLS